MRASAFRAARTSSSTHATTQSGPSAPLIWMAAGVTLTKVPGSNWFDDCRAWVRNDCTLRVWDQSAAPTPPGIAQSR